MFVSPAEPIAIRALGRTSSLPERFGCDMLWMHRGQRIGVQRKEVKDLRASVADGRLGKELRQLATASVYPRLLIIEGSVSWTTDGRIMDSWGQEWTRQQWRGLQWSVQMNGMWVSFTTGIPDTVECVQQFEEWTRKAKHGSLEVRGSVKSVWGSRPSEREYATWVLQGVDGVGPELAGRVFDKAGELPMRWASYVDEKWLTGVNGVGKVKAKRMLRGLEGEQDGVRGTDD